jgi:Flp pilus assembly protein TadD
LPTTRPTTFSAWPPPCWTPGSPGRGEKESSLALWRTAADSYEALQYDEPPAWYFPVHQSLGAALLMSGQPEEAERVFRAALARKMRDGRLLFGLWKSLEAQGRKDTAALVKVLFEQAWKGAVTRLRLEDL